MFSFNAMVLFQDCTFKTLWDLALNFSRNPLGFAVLAKLQIG